MERVSINPRGPRALLVLSLALGVSGCTSLSPQLHPTDIVALEQLEDRDEREQAYEDNHIVHVQELRGSRYTKGRREGARARGWQSLDLILRSDRNSSAALPEKQIRTARVLTGFLAASGLALIAGFAASAREGLDLSRPTGTSAILIGSGVATLAFGIGAGVSWNKARKGYENAVGIYNDSLAMRLGITDADGNYRPPPGVLVDEEGYIILDQKELLVPGNRPAPTSAPLMQGQGGQTPASEPADSEPAPAVESDGPAPVEGETPSLEAAPPPALPSEQPTALHAQPLGLVGPARAASIP